MNKKDIKCKRGTKRNCKDGQPGQRHVWTVNSLLWRGNKKERRKRC
jgi:hypothetical protein